MPSASRRPLLPVAVLFAALAAACGKTSITPKDPAPNTPPTTPSPPPSPSPPTPPPPGVIVVTGTERIGWDQQIDPGTNILDYHFAAYVDTRQTTLPDIQCGTAAGESGYACSAQLPFLTDGQHRLTIVASRVVGGVEPVSARSAEITILKGQVTATETVDAVARSSADPVGAAQASPESAGLRAEIVAAHLTPVTDLAALPDGRVLIAERTGTIRAVSDGAVARLPMASLQRLSQDYGGLMSMTPHPGFALNHLLYVLYAADTDGGVRYRLARGREVAGVLGEFAVLGDLAEAEAGGSGALRFGADGKLYVILSDLATETRPGDAASFRGKVLRLDDDGRTPADSLRGSPIVSSGHKETLGLASAPLDGRLFEAETAESGRINVLRRGAPSIAGERADAPMADLGATARPAGIIVYSGRAFPRWEGQLLVARLDGEGISRMTVDRPGSDVTAIPHLSGYGRIRSLVEAADGSVYFGTANRDARAGPIGAEDDRVVRLRPVAAEVQGVPRRNGP